MTSTYSLLDSQIAEPNINKGILVTVVTWALPNYVIRLTHNLFNGRREIFVNDKLYLQSDYKFLDNGSSHDIFIDGEIYNLMIKTSMVDFIYELY